MPSLVRKTKAKAGAPAYSVARAADRSYQIVDAAGKPTVLRGYKTAPAAASDLRRVLKGTLKAPVASGPSLAEVTAAIRQIVPSMRYSARKHFPREDIYIVSSRPGADNREYANSPDSGIILAFDAKNLTVVDFGLAPAVRGKGYGRKIVATIRSLFPKHRIKLKDESQGFWDHVKLRYNIQTAAMEPIVLELAAENHKPPAAVAAAARRGLELRKKHGRGGTGVGVARARDLSSGKALPLATVKRMASYFARHEVDKQGKDWGNAAAPSAGKIAHLLWGGEPGKRWANSIVKRAGKEAASEAEPIVLELAAPRKTDRRSSTTRKPAKKVAAAKRTAAKPAKKVAKRPAKKPTKKVATKPARSVKIWAAEQFKWYIFRGKSAGKLTLRGKQYPLAPGEKYGITPEPDAKGNYRVTLASVGLAKVFAVLPRAQKALLSRSNPVRKTAVPSKAAPAAGRAAKAVKVVEAPAKKKSNPDSRPSQVRVGADTPLLIKPQVQSGGGWYRDVFWGDDYVGRLLYVNPNAAAKTSSKGGQVWFKLPGNADVNMGQRTEHVGLDNTDAIGPFKSVDDFGKRFAKLKPTVDNIKRSGGGGVVQIRGDAVNRSPISIDIAEAAICRALYEKEAGQTYLLSKSTYTRMLIAAEHHGLVDGGGVLTKRGEALGKLCTGLPKGSVYTFDSRYELALEKYLKLKIAGNELASNPANTEAQRRALPHHGHKAVLRAAGYSKLGPGRWHDARGSGSRAVRHHLLKTGFRLHSYGDLGSKKIAVYHHHDGRRATLTHDVASNSNTFSQSHRRAK